ncbi:MULTISPECIES: AAA family ATPase [Chitinophagaceae]
MNLPQIARQLKDMKENIILIYAFNATGKTRLSVEYKDLTKSQENGQHTGVYYNAFSEDLFVWDNDNENGEQNIKLDVKHCSLNKFHSILNEDAIREKLKPYKPKYYFEFNIEDAEKGIDSIIFYINNEKEKRIKISRGEERIFVWCFFLALFEVEGLADEQEAHFFIDDPVSSLDDHNIFVTAAIIFDLIEKQFEKRKIIITSHHFGFLSILSDWLGKGEKASKFINRDKSKKYKVFILQSNEEELLLSAPNKDVFLYHLRLLQLLDNANKTEIYTYHFALLRQVLENIASFLGVGQFSYVLEQIGVVDKERVAFIVNALSHQRVYYYQTDTPVPDNIEIFKEVFNKLVNTYKFALHVD